MTVPFLSNKFCSSVRFRTVVPGAISGSLHLRFCVTVGFSVATFWVDGVSDGKVAFNL